MQGKQEIKINKKNWRRVHRSARVCVWVKNSDDLSSRIDWDYDWTARVLLCRSLFVDLSRLLFNPQAVFCYWHIYALFPPSKTHIHTHPAHTRLSRLFHGLSNSRLKGRHTRGIAAATSERVCPLYISLYTPRQFVRQREPPDRFPILWHIRQELLLF